MAQIENAPLTFTRCLEEALEQRDALVLSGPGQSALSAAGVLSAVRVHNRTLRAMGIHSSDRIAYALPDSAGTALLALSVMSTAVASPINPRLPQAEIENALKNLKAVSVIVPAGVDSPARRAAKALSLHVIEFSVHEGSYAGHFDLLAPSIRAASGTDGRPAAESDHALIVQTSGTTGKQKIVALTHRNLLSMMLANCDRLGLTPADRCLGVMPLFHIHGLGAVIVSLLSGSSIHILPEFGVQSFYEALRDHKPTWYTAVPTIHQKVLDSVDAHAEIVRQIVATRQLRFIRSGSAPMPAGVPEILERVFNTRYVEACGATECSAYICSNSPDDRRIGSVGKPMPGNEVRILGVSGDLLGPGAEGEIIAKGPGVFSGYEGQPELNEQSFYDGFFRTGDLGYYDQDGYFYLTGRLKEQINRAGMKISPREVDDALRQHPAVSAATTFAVKDHALGEEVHAAVILKPGESATALDLQRFLSTRLADYKTPREIHFVTSIPTNSTGKIVRVGLAEKLGVGPRAEEASVPKELPFTPTQLAIAAIFTRILSQPIDDVNTDFRAAGGDSMQAMDLSLELEKQFGRQIPVSAISNNASIRGLSELLENDGWRPIPATPVVFRTPREGQPTLFCLPGVGGNVWCYDAVARLLPDYQPVVGLPLPGTDGLEAPIDDMGRLADRFVESIRSLQPNGPYLLTGYSFGGRAAFEVALRLRAQGQAVANVILIDTAGPDWPRPLTFRRRVAIHFRRMLDQGPREFVRRAISRRKGTFGMMPEEIIDGLLLSHASEARQRDQLRLIEAAATASRTWTARRIDAPVTVLRASHCSWLDSDVSDESMGWRALSDNRLSVTYVPGSHGTLFHEPEVRGLAEAIAHAIQSQR
jgi:acyl-CoA synthetase (AMP-forming)/AMP-acid ligase II/thioesterase domain-containing protein/acyl carrier protein